MPVSRRHYNIHLNRQVDPVDTPNLGTVAAGEVTITPLAGTTGGIAVDPSATADPGAAITAPPLASNIGPITVTTGIASSSSPVAAPSSVNNNAASASKNPISVGTVVAACIGAFVGAGLIICILFWWCKRPAGQKTRARSVEQRSWNKLAEDEDRWEGMSAVGPRSLSREGESKHGHGRNESQHELDEKNFGMFKKTNSMRTTRTARALEEHGIDLPPFEFSKYHPDLAKELSEPERPFASRQDSGVSWDGETVGDDSFLSLRSVRVDSGTMSPTLAKLTPNIIAPPVHKWESAEVVTPETTTPTTTAPPQNPFTDVNESPRKSVAGNPFFGAQDITRSSSRVRSRSNSYSSRHSRSNSRVSRTRSRALSETRPAGPSDTDPFTDDAIAGIPKFQSTLIEQPVLHSRTDSTSSNNPLATDRAMKSLIAALNLTQEEVEERLRVASMQPSLSSRYSGSNMSALTEDGDDITIRGFPIPPATPTSPNAA
ncbi:hypothetical protein K474DRAFT_1666587 [Panus rudis PR-1116 ss-1]|nr:hypothetical protein K474DRAFT_1666587 [Panus rudis PR-1116 ss-1]